MTDKSTRKYGNPNGYNLSTHDMEGISLYQHHLNATYQTGVKHFINHIQNAWSVKAAETVLERVRSLSRERECTYVMAGEKR